jgi:hypothetical protein
VTGFPNALLKIAELTRVVQHGHVFKDKGRSYGVNIKSIYDQYCNVTYARGSKSLNMSLDACLFVPTPVNEGRCWGLRGVRILPIAWDGTNAEVPDAEKALLIGACDWFIWPGEAMSGAVSGGCWTGFVMISDNEIL